MLFKPKNKKKWWFRWTLVFSVLAILQFSLWVVSFLTSPILEFYLVGDAPSAARGMPGNGLAAMEHQTGFHFSSQSGTAELFLVNGPDVQDGPAYFCRFNCHFDSSIGILPSAFKSNFGWKSFSTTTAFSQSQYRLKIWWPHWVPTVLLALAAVGSAIAYGRCSETTMEQKPTPSNNPPSRHGKPPKR